MEIPLWPDSRPLQLDDRTVLQQRLDQLQPQVSELCFAGLYLFRHAHDYRLARLDNSLLIKGQSYHGEPYLLPPLDADPAAALERIFNDGLSLYGVDETYCARHLPQRRLTLAADRANADYLYLRSDLADLPGRRFHKKRNRIAYLTRRHDCRMLPFAAEHRAACLTLLDELADTRTEPNASPSWQAEQNACAEALSLSDQLGLSGVVALIDGRLRGFSLGERLNRTTAVCHFEKSAPTLEGVAQLLNQAFAASQPGEIELINREQDLGEAGLRQAKSSYCPLELRMKYRVSPA